MSNVDSASHERQPGTPRGRRRVRRLTDRARQALGGSAELDGWQRLTDRAHQVFALAQEEAQALGHNYLGTEHLLLGLLREQESVAARTLATLDVRLDEVRRRVERMIGRGTPQALGACGLCLTPRTKRVLELAHTEARRLNHHYVGTEHLLLGVLIEGEGVAATMLHEFGVDHPRAERAGPLRR